MLNALQALGNEPFQVQFDGVLENIGTLNLSAECQGLMNFKETCIKFGFAKVCTTYEFKEFLEYFKDKGILNEAGMKLAQLNDELCDKMDSAVCIDEYAYEG